MLGSGRGLGLGLGLGLAPERGHPQHEARAPRDNASQVVDVRALAAVEPAQGQGSGSG